MQPVRFTGFWAGTETESFIGPAFLTPFPALGPVYAVGSKVTGDVSLLRLEPDRAPVPVAQMEQLSSLDGFVIGGLIASDDATQEIWAWDGLTGRVLAFDNPADGTASTVTTNGGQVLTTSGVAQVGDYLAVASAERDEILLLQDVGGGLRVQDRVEDTAKSSVSGLSDLLALDLGGRDFLISASHDESGVTSFEVVAGELVQRDHIGAKDGLWVDGVSKLASVEVEGTQYVIALSADANSLHSLRVNDQGVFFTADTLWDTRDTRFEGAQDMDLFEWQGRNFLVTGGKDAGLSVVEILPDGSFLHHHSIAQTQAWDIGPVTQIETQLLGDQAQIMVTGSQGAGVAHLTLELADVGSRISGSDGADNLSGNALDNLIVGGAGNDRLSGLAGDDILIAGTGSDVLTGGGGADVFVFRADGVRDRITDYQPGVDRIDLSDWGRVYHHDDLTLTETNFGARIVWRGETLDVHSAIGGPIAVGDWGAEDFIF